jgi:hypothetical protein
VIDIDRAWLSDLASIDNITTSTIVAQLPKDLFGAASIIVDNQMMIFGGRGIKYGCNWDMLIFNVDNNSVSTLPSVFINTYFGEKTYFMPKGNFKFQVVEQFQNFIFCFMEKIFIIKKFS